MLENAIKGEWEKPINVPATVEDAAVVDKAKEIVRMYFEQGRGQELKAKL